MTPGPNAAQSTLQTGDLMSRHAVPSWTILAGSLLLCACSSPYFVQDPRALVIDRDEVPHFLKSLRCELATYIAANNQRNIMFAAEAKTHGLESAEAKYQYYEIDPRAFGAVNLTLQVQDNLGLGNGTQYERSSPSSTPTHLHTLMLGPTAGDQSTYAATWGFILPQDALMLRASPARDSQQMPFSCYSNIPKRDPPPFGSIYTEDDLDALARNDFPDYALFRRVLVNNAMPLAAGLEDVGNSISGATLHWHDPQQKPDEMIPGQMSYQFQIVASAGLNVTYGLTSPLWPVASTQVSGGIQQTNTVLIFLNGIEAAVWYNAPFGNALNKEAKSLPVIKVAGSAQPLPTYVGRRQSRGRLQWPLIISRPQAPAQ